MEESSEVTAYGTIINVTMPPNTMHRHASLSGAFFGIHIT